MSTTVLPQPRSASAAKLTPRNDVNLLRGVSWDDYCAYRDDPDNDAVRMHYGDRDLLLMTTGRPHEKIKLLLDRILVDWAIRNEIDIDSSGQWTMQRRSRKKGLEADNCYYVSSFPAIRGKKELDLEIDPPPDVAIEVDVTTYSAHKFAVYAGLGISEVWIWEDGEIVVYRLSESGEYQRSVSHELPGFPFQAAVVAINEHWDDGDRKVIEAFRSADPSYSPES